VNALTQWKSGKRRNDPDGQMQAIASRLSEADIAAVAAYYASQPPPSHSFVANSSGSAPMYISPARRGASPAGQAPLEK
jgi:cytochrome c553